MKLLSCDICGKIQKYEERDDKGWETNDHIVLAGRRYDDLCVTCVNALKTRLLEIPQHQKAFFGESL